MAKAARKSDKKPVKRSNRKNKTTYNSYIAKVLKGASKEKLTLSGRAMKILNSLVVDFVDRLATTGGALARGQKKQTLGSRELQAAVRLTLPNELAKHAMSEAAKAVAKCA